jgi:hypothetical protein
MGVAGKKGVGRGVSVFRKGGFSVKIKRQEPPNGGFGQGTVVCCRIHGGNAKARKYLSGPRCQENSLGNSCSGFRGGRLRGQVYSRTKMRPSSSGTSGAFRLWIVDLKRRGGRMMCCIKVARPRRRPHAKQGDRLMPGYAGLSVLGQYVPIPLACAPGGSAPPLMWKPLCFQESRSARRLGLTCLPSRRVTR